MLGFKYLLSIDGSGWQHISYWGLFTNSIIFKQETDVLTWPYAHGLQPWVHYIPVRSDLSDLLTHVDWAIAHDDRVQDMVANANAFAEEHLSFPRVALYLDQLLRAYDGLAQRESM